MTLPIVVRILTSETGAPAVSKLTTRATQQPRMSRITFGMAQNDRRLLPHAPRVVGAPEGALGRESDYPEGPESQKNERICIRHYTNTGSPIKI
jgi:hypothetical protein